MKNQALSRFIDRVRHLCDMLAVERRKYVSLQKIPL